MLFLTNSVASIWDTEIKHIYFIIFLNVSSIYASITHVQNRYSPYA